MTPLTPEQIKRLQALADQRSGDPYLDAMKEGIVKALVREKLE
jgi:hypothetical protein